MIDLRRLAAVPTPVLTQPAAVQRGIADSIAYLGSDEALRSLDLDPYWPKWHSPWWHMLLLEELGEARAIPAATVAAMITSLDRLLHFFPLRPEDAPGADPKRDIACHCALGNMARVLTSCGVDLERSLPWVRPWFARYQMADGGFNCDESAYLASGECPSSMVATIAPLEALLALPALGADESTCRDRAAAFLVGRGLVRGSETTHNAAERQSAQAWPQLTFPRFYFYDVLRGLSALVSWAERRQLRGVSVLGGDEMAGVVSSLLERWPDGVVCVERRAFAAPNTIVPTADRSPSPRAPATSFPLLDAVSAVGEASERLTREWTATRATLVRLLA
jgi:hypothetical protein